MKRIVISITNNLTYDRRIIRIARSFEAMGLKVTVLGRHNKLAVSDHSGIHKVLIHCWFKAGFMFYLEFNIRLAFKLLFTPANILYSVDTDTLLANTLVSIIRRKPLVVDMHELFTEVPELQKKQFKKSIWKAIERFGISRSTLRFTVSETIAKHYQQQYHKRFDIVRNMPVQKGNENDVVQSNAFTLVYVGALNMGRGLEQLISAISKMEDVHLTCLGKGDLYDKLVQLSEDLGVSDRVNFEGLVEPNDLEHHLKSAHIGINILDPSSQSYYLSLANKYFDYIHAGIPCISMDFPEYRQLNAAYETALLIPDLREEEIIKAISQLKEDQSLYERLARNTSLASAQWNWQKESKALRSILDL